MPNYQKNPSTETVVSTATYKCSSSYTNTKFMTKNNQKTKTLINKSRDFSRPGLKSREP